MSEDNSDKTELPTQRRREEARAQGQFAYSHELLNGLLLMTGTVGLWWCGTALAGGLGQELQLHLRTPRMELTVSDIPSYVTGMLHRGLQLIGGLVVGIFAVSLAANLAQAGLHINTESLGPKWDKINPAMNWNRLFSTEGLMRGGLALCKVSFVGVAAWWVLSDRGVQIAQLSDGLLTTSVSIAWGIATELMIAAASVLLLIGALDYGWQWWRNEQMLRMSREELKREQKDDTGDPAILSRRRQRARELVSQRRMLEEVPKATLVITNPTHLAVALRYERGVTGAPVVIAKGKDQFALQIAARARRHGIAVVERKPVARALFKMVKVGQEIPQALYVAVSEVLGYVYRLRGLSG
ncbi:MAG: EscU/YscU/HrcU family type III secretion system export apparatus switch protein [Planctomycetes bacterium]|nr:EscU/YscU/HrcU family type III secretion system export apparatus switch protein [Planctomycetota bacterium]